MEQMEQLQENVPINGVCNNSQRDSCIAGNVSDLVDISTHYRWECKGLYGGTTATDCQKAKF